MILDLIQQFFSGPIAQDLAYHNFCDSRTFFGVPNFMDVVSNLPFIVFGWMGVKALSEAKSDLLPETIPMWGVFFVFSIVIGLGSGYYHLSPDNNTLFWDRLPMAVGFMSLLAIVISERVSAGLGKILFPILLILGVGSVWYWAYTESKLMGDLRPYAVVQFGSLLALVILVMWRRHAFARDKYLYLTLFFYVAAKVFEMTDCAVYHLTHEIISGHTLKHILAAMGVFTLVKYVNVKA